MANKNIIMTPGRKAAYTRKRRRASESAHQTGRWAKIMTKWLASYSSKGGKRWQFVSFEGPKGGESRGIVDIIAIRKDHKFSKKPLKIGDLFEIILIQVKGGSAPMPSSEEILRLSKVGEYYHAKRTILAIWKKGKEPTLYSLVNSSWEKIDANDAFK